MAFTFVTSANLDVASVDVPTDGLAKSSGPAVSTRNAFNCLIIIIHDGVHGAGCLAHLAPGTAEGVVIQSMVDYLVNQHRATANTLDVLIGGGNSREQDGTWRGTFSASLTAPGLALANVHDARTEKGRTDIGANGRAGICGLVYRPQTGEVASLGLTESASNVVAASVGVSSFTVNANGTLVGIPQKSKCYVTTATCAALGLPDDCEELQTLRWYRDTVLLADPARQKDVDAYYTSAPAIVEAIDRSPDAAKIYETIYREGVTPALAAIRRGDFAGAYSIYRHAMEDLERRFAGR